jgi:proline iminopeptidase
MLQQLLTPSLNILLIQCLLLSFSLSGQVEHNTVKVEDGVISYRSYGSGPTMLIINGGPGFNSNGFEALATNISKLGFQTILFDQRGTGRSKLKELNEQALSLSKMIEDCESLRKAIGAEEWIVLGHSFGGMLANAYAQQYPNRVSKLILSNSGGLDLKILALLPQALGEKLGEEKVQLLERYYQASETDDDTIAAQQYRKILASAYVVDQKYVESIAKRLAEIDQAINQMVWQDMQKNNFDLVKSAATFKQEVLIIKGESDLLPLEINQLEKDSYPNSKMVILPDCGHYPWLDQAELFYELIKELK